MKAIVFVLLVSVASVSGQGLLSFQNGAFQRFYAGEPLTPTLMSTAYHAFTFYIAWGTSSGNLVNSTMATPIYNSSTTAGMLDGNTSFVINGAAGGATIFMKMYGFESSFGSYANALASGGMKGSSTEIQVTLATSPSPGTVIFAGTSDPNHIAPFFVGFDDYPVAPEPSTVVLGVIGMAGLVVVRCRKRVTIYTHTDQ